MKLTELEDKAQVALGSANVYCNEALYLKAIAYFLWAILIILARIAEGMRK